MAADKLHLTLVFLGAVDAELRRSAERAATSVRAAPFALELDHTGWFARARVLWSAPARAPEALHGLAGALSRALLACGYQPERRALRAHVTLARKVQGPFETLAHAPIAWEVRQFHLVRSHTRSEGAAYEIVATWELREAPDGAG